MRNLSSCRNFILSPSLQNGLSREVTADAKNLRKAVTILSTTISITLEILHSLRVSFVYKTHFKKNTRKEFNSDDKKETRVWNCITRRSKLRKYEKINAKNFNLRLISEDYIV